MDGAVIPAAIFVVVIVAAVLLIVLLQGRSKFGYKPPLGSYPNLPVAGTLDQYPKVTPSDYLATSVLVFRSQMTGFQTSKRWNFPDPAAATSPSQQEQALFPSLIMTETKKNPAVASDRYDVIPPRNLNATIPTLYSNVQAAQQNNLPWPPLASAQLITYYLNPNVPLGATTPAPPTTLMYRHEAAIPLGVQLPNFSLPNPSQYLSYPSQAQEFVRVGGLSNLGGAFTYQTVRKNNKTVNETLNQTELVAVALQFQQTGVVYVEIAGGKGGKFQTGRSTDPSTVTFPGGAPGLVWAYVQVKKGDTWYVQLSQDGSSQTNNVERIVQEVPLNNSAPSYGGSASFLSGAEGGGSTWISTSYPNTPKGPQLAQSLNDGKATSVILAAGGGGGASQNAYGGSAGLSMPTLSSDAFKSLYGSDHPNRFFAGYPGGSTNVIDPLDEIATVEKGRTKIQQTSLVNQLSGGGGTQNAFGQSYSRHTLPDSGNMTAENLWQCRGKYLRGGDGLNDPPGGGGGGAGYRGGGAGTWNNRYAPNNLHGAGGGGSSYVDPNLQRNSCIFEDIVNANPWLNPNNMVCGDSTSSNFLCGNTIPTMQDVLFDASNYFMLVLPPTA